ncbi:hypothetical protein GCM10022290_33070 [Sagittula marina]
MWNKLHGDDPHPLLVQFPIGTGRDWADHLSLLDPGQNKITKTVTTFIMRTHVPPQPAIDQSVRRYDTIRGTSAQ